MNYSIQYVSAGLSGAAHDGRTFETFTEANRYRHRYDSAAFTTVWPTAVDPADCGCTECLIGQYIPLDQANPQHIVDMLFGDLDNHTGDKPEIEIVVGVGTRVFTLPAAAAQQLLEVQP